MDEFEPLIDGFKDYTAETNPALDAEIQRYFESPHLLDAFLEPLVRKLTHEYLSNTSVQWPLSSLYILSNVRGYKQVSLYFDTEPSLLQLTLDQCQNNQSWRCRYILLLWIATLLLLPFSLETLGDGLYESIFALCTSYLVQSSKERDAAALVMSRLLSRSDLQQNTRKFLEWQLQNSIFGIGILQTVAYLCKSKVWYPQEFLQLAEKAYGNVEIKLAIKIKTRIALQFPETEDTESTINFLFDSLENPSSDIRYSSAKALARICHKLGQNGHPDLMSEIVQEVFDGFQHDQLSGRDRLSIVSEHKWHGSLLFIAELVRQKVPLNHDEILLFLDDALHFEQKQLNHSVGSSVRDAACYVCWAIFKYCKNVKENFLTQAYESLIGLACFDREVNIRLAAAAALQEGLGRHHGMQTEKALNLIQLINFQSVGQTAKCYLSIAPCADPKPNLRYLVQHGVCSWDVNLRRLAARSLEKFEDPPIQLLLDLFSTPDQDTKHGVLCSLGGVYTGPQELIKPILYYGFDFTSETVCEGYLAFLRCVDSPGKYMAKCMWSSCDIIVDRVAELVPLISPVDRAELCQEWFDLANDSSAYVAAIASGNKQLLNKLSGLADPKSRKIVIENLERSPESEKIVENALSDYQQDKRGDVGSWVRIAAVKRVKEWKLVTEGTTKALWRLSSESLGQLRAMSSECLEAQGHVFDKSTTVAYFNSVFELANPKDVVAGAIVCIGGGSGNQQAAHGALYALLNNIGKFAPYILELGWKGTIGLCTLHTVVKTLELGYSTAYDQKELLRLGYNATINTRESARILCGIEILGFIDLNNGKARERLVKLCGHPYSQIRVRAAEVLFENEVSNDILIETDWAGQNYLIAQETLEKSLTS